MTRWALELEGVHKAYGRTQALRGLDLRVARGTLLGLVGPNGAGKTTTFGVVSGALEPDAGEVRVLGEGRFDPREQAGALGVLPQDCALNPHSSARQLLTFFARLQGATRGEAQKDADKWLDAMQLADRAQARVGQLSHGMKRRLAVAQALLGDPQLVLLDEPTGGLDPHLVVAMREILRRERGRRTLIVSSHILSDLEQTCDRIAFMEQGRCIEVEDVATMKAASRQVTLTLTTPVDPGRVREALGDRTHTLEETTLRYELTADERAEQVAPATLAALVAAGVSVLEVQVGGTLEEAYLERRAQALASKNRH